MSNLDFLANFQEKLPASFIYLLWLKFVNIKPAFSWEPSYFKNKYLKDSFLFDYHSRINALVQIRMEWMQVRMNWIHIRKTG